MLSSSRRRGRKWRRRGRRWARRRRGSRPTSKRERGTA